MMSDNRPTLETDKEINLAQLDTELGGYGLNGAEGLVQVVEGSPVTLAELTAGVAAHVPVWPERAARAAASAHARSLGFTDEMIAVMYPGLVEADISPTEPEPTADDYTTQPEPLIEAP
jgi:hypothetical protein